VAKVNVSGTALVYCGYIGGSDFDYSNGIAVDGSGNAYVTGITESTEATFPVKRGPDLTYNGGYYDAFVVKVNASGRALVYCGYIGGASDEYGYYGIAVDSSGNAYITGITESTEATFPVKGGPDLTHNGYDDAFVAKVNASGTALVYCGYIGGSEYETSPSIAVDGSGNAYVTGETSSTEATFPVVSGPDLTYNGGYYDAFVAKVNASGTALVYCGYIGGSYTDDGYGIAVDGSGDAYITGITESTEATFPVKGGPDLTQNGGWFDVFVAKIFYYYIYAPTASGVKVLNRSFSQAEYINILSWQANPANAGLDITKYRIYLMNNGTRSYLAEVGADQSQYFHRKAGQGKLDYAIVAVHSSGREGAPALVTVQ
jgi:hypothetical protein